MKVYVLKTNAVHDFEDYGIGVEVFRTKKEAIKALNALWRDEKSCLKEDFHVRDWVVEKNKDSYEAHVDGEWCRYHTCGYVQECELK